MRLCAMPPGPATCCNSSDLARCHLGLRLGPANVSRDFARRHGVPVHVTWMLDCYSYPAWYIVKPEAPVA